MRIVLCTKESQEDSLMHYRLGGEKKGVRRWQNKDGSYTPAGYKHYAEMYGWGKRKKKADDAADTADKTSRKGTERSQEKADTANDKANLSRKILNDNFTLDKQRVEILKKNDAWNNVKDPSTFSKEDQDELSKINKKMSENRKAYADAEYVHSKALEDNYAKTIKSEKDVDWIDPKYRKFSSKDEKAAAEEAYFKKLSEDPADGDIAKWNREVGHLANTVSNLSLDGYMGVPKSPRQKAEYDYVDTDDDFDTYNNWRPKYEKTKEWTDLEAERSRIKRDTGMDTAYDTWSSSWSSSKVSASQRDRAWKDFIKAREKYKEQTKSIDDREHEIQSEFHKKQLKNLCLDLGYEPTKANMMFLESWCWYD